MGGIPGLGILQRNKKKAIGAGLLAGAAVGAVAGRKRLGRAVRGIIGGSMKKGRSSVSRLRSRLQRLQLKTKIIQAKRKLFREELKV